MVDAIGPELDLTSRSSGVFPAKLEAAVIGEENSRLRGPRGASRFIDPGGRLSNRPPLITSAFVGHNIMSKLSLIRFGAYAILIVAALSATRQRYVIPIHLPRAMPDWIDWFGERDGSFLSIRRDVHPNFGDTVLSGSEVLRLAGERTEKEGIPLRELEDPAIVLNKRGERLEWQVTREVSRSIGDGTIWVVVFVDDETGRTRLERHKHPY